MSKDKKFHFFNQDVFFAFCLLIAQQLIVASSTIWITSLIANIQQGTFSYPLLGLYLTSLFLPYFPGAGALIEMTKAKMKANVQYIDSFAHIYRGQIVEWTNSSQHSSISAMLTSEGPQAINGFLDYSYHFGSCGLNVLFNLTILAFIIDPWLLASYSVGILLAFLVLKIQKKLKKRLSLKAQQGRVKWISMVLKLWDNVLIDNSYNFTIWKNKIDYRAKRLAKSGIELEKVSQGVSIGMAFLLLGPSFALICYLPILHEFNLTILAIMVVALPRLFQVLSYSYEMLFVLADFPMQTSRLKTITKLLDSSNLYSSEQASLALKKRIQWDKIRISSNSTLVSLNTFLEGMPSQGRYTIRGENGSGKSSFLFMLKVLKGHEAFYLPAKHDLFFQRSRNGFSTGQLARETLRELLEKLPAQVVLLDEWDANLDTPNQEKLSQLIDQISQNKCVVEVRHR